MRRPIALIIVLLALSSSGVRADVRTVQKTQVQFTGMLGRMVNLFGGKAAREGVTSTVIVKGDRKLESSDNSGQIIDLAEEKVYDLDLRRQTYKVTTFAELRRQMEEAARRAEQDARREAPAEKGETAPEADEDVREVEIDVTFKNTGDRKTINGFETEQTVMTITVREKGKTLEEGGGLVLTSDMWLAADQAAMREILDFELRYAQKLHGGMAGVSADQLAAAMAMYPMLKDAIARMNSEGAKVEGTAILTTMTVEAVRSAEQMDAEVKEDRQPAGRGIGGLLGGLARRTARRGDDDAKPRITFMTSTVEVLELSNQVASDAVAIPAGFKEIP